MENARRAISDAAHQSIVFCAKIAGMEIRTGIPRARSEYDIAYSFFGYKINKHDYRPKQIILMCAWIAQQMALFTANGEDVLVWRELPEVHVDFDLDVFNMTFRLHTMREKE